MFSSLLLVIVYSSSASLMFIGLFPSACLTGLPSQLHPVINQPPVTCPVIKLPSILAPHSQSLTAGFFLFFPATVSLSFVLLPGSLSVLPCQFLACIPLYPSARFCIYFHWSLLIISLPPTLPASWVSLQHSTMTVLGAEGIETPLRTKKSLPLYWKLWSYDRRKIYIHLL